MSLSAAVIDALVASGATVEQLAAVIKADLADREAQEAARLEAKRAGNAERQARFRQRHRVENNDSNALLPVTERYSVTSPPSPDKSPPDPQKLTPTPRTHGGDAPAHEATAQPWACPPGVDPDHWRDFRRNRRRKNLTDTETAYRGQLRSLERFASDEWPPGRLVQRAAEMGWGKIVDPADYEDFSNGHHRPAARANGHNRAGNSRASEIDDAARFLGFE